MYSLGDWMQMPLIFDNSIMISDWSKKCDATGQSALVIQYIAGAMYINFITAADTSLEYNQ